MLLLIPGLEVSYVLLQTHAQSQASGQQQPVGEGVEKMRLLEHMTGIWKEHVNVKTHKTQNV
jgi:hypothetical protein